MNFDHQKTKTMETKKQLSAKTSKIEILHAGRVSDDAMKQIKGGERTCGGILNIAECAWYTTCSRDYQNCTDNNNYSSCGTLFRETTPEKPSAIAQAH